MNTWNHPSYPRLARAEYWLLELVTRWRIPLFFLEAEGYSGKNSIEAVFNKPGHGLPRVELIECLWAMLGEGLIEAWIGFDEPTPTLTRERLIAAVEFKPSWESRRDARAKGQRLDLDIAYQLTAKGGALWEAFAVPDWEQFFSEDFDNSTCTGAIHCMERWRLEKYVEASQFLGHVIDLDSVQITECGEWEATYWKRLPLGFVGRFAWTPAPDPQPTQSMLERLAFSGAVEMRDSWNRWR